MFIEVESAKTAANHDPDPRVVVTPHVLKQFFPLNNCWEAIKKGLKEDWNGWAMNVGGWGRMIGDYHVLVLLNRCGEYHTTWRMYVDGEMVYHMKDIVVMMGSAKDAMELADAYTKTRNMSRWNVVELFEKPKGNSMSVDGIIQSFTTARI